MVLGVISMIVHRGGFMRPFYITKGRCGYYRIRLVDMASGLIVCDRSSRTSDRKAAERLAWEWGRDGISPVTKKSSEKKSLDTKPSRAVSAVAGNAVALSGLSADEELALLKLLAKKHGFSLGSVQFAEFEIKAGKNISYSTDPLGNISVQETDSRGNIVRVAKNDKSGTQLTEVTYKYNAMGEMLKAFDAKGHPITAEYDLLGRRTALESLDSGRQEFFYDECSNVVRENNSVLRENNKQILYEYDGLNRLIRIDYPEEEDFILKSPMKRIHRIKTPVVIKQALSEEQIEVIRKKAATSNRNLAIIDFLLSSGIRVSELVRLNRSSVSLNSRSCIVFGKGAKQREIYFDVRTKIELENYLKTRKDKNRALFVTERKKTKHGAFFRLSVNSVEKMIREIGVKTEIENVHPHRFRRTMATRAIDKGMPIEQVQVLLGHTKIDTTLRYANVQQANVRHSHQKYIC